MFREYSSGGQSHDPRFSDGSSAFHSMGGNEDLSERSAFLLGKTTENDEPKTLDKESQVDAGEHRATGEGESHSHDHKTPNHHDDEHKQQEAQSETTHDGNQHAAEPEDIPNEKTTATETLREISAATEILTQPDTHRSNCGSCHLADPEDQKQQRLAVEVMANDQNAPAKRNRPPTKAALKHLSRTMSRTSDSVRKFGRIIGKKSEQANRMWNFILSQALGISSICGLLSILLLSMAVVSCSWRSHEFKFEDRNGNNTISVFCSLDSVRRIHQLKRFNETGTLYLLDKPRKYADLIDSPYCMEDLDSAEKSTHSLPHSSGKDANQTQEKLVEDGDLRPESSGRLSEAAGLDARAAAGLLEGVEEPEDLQTDNNDDTNREGSRNGTSSLPADNSLARNSTLPGAALAHSGVNVETVSPRMDDSEAKQENDGLFRSHWDLAPFQVIFGRDPAASGNMTDEMARVRRTLLGPAVYELNCRYLPDLKRAGEALWTMIIPAFVFSAIGLLCGWLCTTWGRVLTVGLIPPTFALKMLGSLSWVVSLALLVAGLGTWGTISDVAACVSSAGGSTVCKLGVSSGVAVIALVLNLLATIWFAVHFTDRHITELKVVYSDDHTGNSSSFEREPVELQGAEHDLEAGKQDEQRHSSEGRHHPKIVVSNAEELTSSESGGNTNGNDQQGPGNHLRNRGVSV